MEQFLASSERAATLLAGCLGKNGVLRDPEVAKDMCAQNKLPVLLAVSGRTVEAHRLLDRIKRDFMQENGDFLSFPDKEGRDRKSGSFPMSHFWSYMNVWITIGAQKMERFDISYPAYAYCKRFYHPERQMVCVTEPFAEATAETTVDMLSTAHLGKLALVMADLDMAKNCGEGLLKFMSAQPRNDVEILLRANATSGEIITDPPNDMQPFYSVKRDSPKQLYFFLGYHGIFMIKLFKATKDERFLNSAKEILDFALTCHESMCTFSYSHKVAMAAALVAVETKEAKYRRLAIGLGEYLVSIQDNEGFYGSKDFQPIDKYDQTAEIGIWLREIPGELGRII